MMRVASLVLALLIAGSGAPRLAGYQESAPPIFRTETNLVVLHVNVFDRGGRAVTGLERQHFMVLEDDRPQEITFFSGEDVPVTVGLVIDNSTSMLTQRDLVVAGGMAFANSSHPEDELFIVSFTEHVRLALPPTLPFTSSRPVVQATLNSLRPGGKTALYEAVIRALDHVDRGSHQKRVVIVLSDGDDTASRAMKEEMFARAEASDAIIYAVGVIDPASGSRGNRGVLRTLTRIGGGLAYFPTSQRRVVDTFEQIAANVRQGYSIGYLPISDPSGNGFRRVTVTVRVPGRRGLTARYRQGYMAPGVSRPD
jgi:Ca-activated chloride channel family protein